MLTGKNYAFQTDQVIERTWLYNNLYINISFAWTYNHICNFKITNKHEENAAFHC